MNRTRFLALPVLSAAIIGAASLGLAGTANAEQDASTITYGSSGVTATIDCGDGSALHVDGSNDILTVTGTCSSARITGDANQVAFDSVTDDIDIPGNRNNVNVKADFYGSNLTIGGNDNSINTGTG